MLKTIKNKAFVLILMSGFVCIQAMDNDSILTFKAAAAVIGVAVTGVTVWRMITPSDKDIIDDINLLILDKALTKYNQSFNIKNTLNKGEEEKELLINLIDKLGYPDQYQEQDTIQANLNKDAQELRNLQNSIWFRSYFNTNVASKYNEIDQSRLQARRLRAYFKSHDKFFKGYSICKEQNDLVRGIRKMYIGRQTYPLVYVVSQYIQDVQWIESLKKGVYPQLENKLHIICTNAQDSILALQDHPEYIKEQERKDQQDIHSVSGMNAQAQLLAAQTAADQVKIATQNLLIAQQHLAYEKERNERERVNARVQELYRYGYSDMAIQQQLNCDKIVNMLKGFFWN